VPSTFASDTYEGPNLFRFAKFVNPKFARTPLYKGGDLRDIVLFSYTIGIDRREYLCYVLNFNTPNLVIFQIIVVLVVESAGKVWHF